MYENTGRRAHLMAADLIDAGVDVHDVYRRIYEGVPYGKLTLLARGLANVERYDGGRLTMSALSAADFAASGAEESYSEGVVDQLRAVAGHRCRRGRSRQDGRPDALVYARSRCGPPTTASTSPHRSAQGGGGHRQAAGFTTGSRTTSWSSSCAIGLGAALTVCGACPPTTFSSSTSRPGSRRTTSWPRYAGRCRAGPRSATRNARSVRHRAAARPRRSRHPDAALSDGAAQAL